MVFQSSDALSKEIEFKRQREYVTLHYQGHDAGLCTLEFSRRLSESFKREERLYAVNGLLRKALQRACKDVIERSGGDRKQANALVRRYLEDSMRPEHGPRAIAYLLSDRKKALDMGDREFLQFCDSYRLSPAEIKDIAEGKEISDAQLKAISRILGSPVQELQAIRDGASGSGVDRLARLLGVSAQEIADWFPEE